MKRIRPSTGLAALFIAAFGFMESGCASVHLVRTSSSPAEEPPFEDVMFTGSHILYRVPKDKTITPIHVAPQVTPLTPDMIDVADTSGTE